MTRSKEEIKKDVVDQLYWDYRVDSSNIKVGFRGDTLVLTGSVPNFTAKNAAEFDVRTIEGVFDIDNKLEVLFPEDYEAPSELVIKANVENALLLNGNVDFEDIDVSVDNGIVKLNGLVDAYWKKIEAESEASSVEGVLLVINKIAITPLSKRKDESIAKDITSAIDRSWNVNIDNVNIKVEDGVVTLFGKVNDWSAHDAAVSAARYTGGVVDVINNLRLRSFYED